MATAAWFEKARFGMFVHLLSVLAEVAGAGGNLDPMMTVVEVETT